MLPKVFIFGLLITKYLFSSQILAFFSMPQTFFKHKLQALSVQVSAQLAQLFSH
jgi:hypothetical protein